MASVVGKWSRLSSVCD